MAKPPSPIFVVLGKNRCRPSLLKKGVEKYLKIHLCYFYIYTLQTAFHPKYGQEVKYFTNYPKASKLGEKYTHY